MIRGCSYRQQKTSKRTTTNILKKAIWNPEAGLFYLPPLRIVIQFQDGESSVKILKMIPKSLIFSTTKPFIVESNLLVSVDGKKGCLWNSFICPRRHIWAGIWHQCRGCVRCGSQLASVAGFPPPPFPFSPYILPTWKGQGLLGSRAGV